MAMSLSTGILAFQAHIIGVRNLSPHTVEDYSRTLQRLADFLDETTPLDAITTNDIERFLSHWQGITITPGGIVAKSPKQLSPKTILNMQVAISAFWTWAVKKGHAPVHITRDKIPFVRPQQRQIIPYTDEQIAALLDACETRSYILPNGTLVTQKRPTRKRDRALLYWLLSTGTRASETVALRGPDVNLLDRSAVIRYGHAKNQKERQVFFGHITVEALIDYLADRDVLSSSSRRNIVIPDVPIFVTMPTKNRPSRQMSRDGLLHLIYQLAKFAGVPDAYVHKFRHTFAKHAIMNGCGEEALRRMLGHSTLDTVRRYVHLFGEDVQAIHRAIDPVDNLLKRR